MAQMQFLQFAFSSVSKTKYAMTVIGDLDHDTVNRNILCSTFLSFTTIIEMYADQVEMKRTVSLGNLHDTMEHQEALQEFYTFMDEASRLGESGVKDAHLSAYSHALGGALHFFHFETRFMDHAVEIISNSQVHRNIQALGCTGGGAFKFEQSFLQRLGVKMLQMDEMECLVRGLQFALANIPEECYTYRPPPEKALRSDSEGDGAGGDEDGDGNSDPDPKDNLRNKRMRKMAEITAKRVS